MSARRRTTLRDAIFVARDFWVGTACMTAAGALSYYALAASDNFENYRSVLNNVLLSVLHNVLLALFTIVSSAWFAAWISTLPAFLFVLGLFVTDRVLGVPPAIPRRRAILAGVAYVLGAALLLLLLRKRVVGVSIAQIVGWLVLAPLLAPALVAWGGAPLTRMSRR